MSKDIGTFLYVDVEKGNKMKATPVSFIHKVFYLLRFWTLSVFFYKITGLKLNKTRGFGLK